MVADSHTIVDPRAVVVKSLYTVPTDRAVSTPTSADAFAIGAQLSTVDHVEHVHKFYVLIY